MNYNMVQELICIVCPKGCHIKVDGENISGYTCLRGLSYAKQESINPLRTITSTVMIEGEENLVCPVKTSHEIPKKEIFNVMKEINKVKVKKPIKINQILIKNLLNLGVDIISTKEFL